MSAAVSEANSRRPRVALDIGSTVIKVARLDGQDQLVTQDFFPRDFGSGIEAQVATVLKSLDIDVERDTILGCSSANGGLRVGIIGLSQRYSCAAFRNQVLLAGANPVFVHDLDSCTGDPRRVDILLVGGGIDCADAAPMQKRLLDFNPEGYRYDALLYAGNRHLAAGFARRFPSATVLANPLGDTLSTRVGSVFDAVRCAYLDDLVLKEGLRDLPPALARSIRPTPEVASRGFLRSVMNQSGFEIVGPCLVLDIGGATTDLHYTVELVSEDSPARPASGVSVARYVFTDLGIVASRDTLLLQLRNHPQLYEFLAIVLGSNVRDVYTALREGEHAPTPALLAYACLFIALDRFRSGNGPGLPVGQVGQAAQIILTGGAAQALDEAVVARLVALMAPPGGPPPLVQVDRRYEIWVAGITWSEDSAG
jgi:MutL protein